MTGEWATYDKKIIKDISNSYSTHYEYTTEAMELMHNTSNLDVVNKIKSINDIKTYKNLLSSSLSRKIEKLENKLDSCPYKEREFIFKSEIKRAKKVLKDGNT